SFTILQHLAIWGNLVVFYIINWIVSALPRSEMYTIMYRLCRQPAYWNTMFLIVAAGMGPVLALKSSLDSDLAPMSISQSKNGRNSVFEPLLSDSPSAVRRSFGPGATFDFFQSPKSSSYPRNKDN
nr:phospholipid-transporting ATPase 2 [Tanacetum cinerariifolium]